MDCLLTPRAEIFIVTSVFGCCLFDKRARYTELKCGKLTVYKCFSSHWWNRELTLKCKLKCYVKPMKEPLSVSPSKGYQGTTRGKEKILLTSVGIELTTSGLDLPLLCRLSYEVGQRKIGDDLCS